jgi:hypothetical protein
MKTTLLLKAMPEKFLPLTRALLLFALFSGLMSNAVAQTARGNSEPTSLKFEVTISTKLGGEPKDGRLFVVISRTQQPEPRTTIGETDVDTPPVLARDVKAFAPGVVGRLDESAAIFPVENLTRLPTGDYFVQALFDSNIDLKSVNAPGNLYSAVRRVRLDPARADVVRLELTERVPPEELPEETAFIKYVRIQSPLLSKFHGRPIYLRAGVLLPRDHAKETERRYPLRVHIGGYGERFTGVQRLMRNNSESMRAWLADDSPRMILLYLDGDGPLGDPYQVNSDNHGPYGDAVTQELIPYVEQKFRGVGRPEARFLDGGSTGGWVSLALQIFYPDFFNGAWSFCPDGVDFRAFQLINIYTDKNAYVNTHGFERPSARDKQGDTRFTIRHEAQMENVLGAGDSWTMSGQQWGAWNATYGPRGADGRPRALWNPQTGEIDRSVVEHWKKYDLRMILEKNWPTLAPKLRGKIHIWMGDADSYFLNNGVYLLDDFLSKAQPPYEGTITYGRREGHCWIPLSQRQLLDAMAAAWEKSRR